MARVNVYISRSLLLYKKNYQVYFNRNEFSKGKLKTVTQTFKIKFTERKVILLLNGKVYTIQGYVFFTQIKILIINIELFYYCFKNLN